MGLADQVVSIGAREIGKSYESHRDCSGFTAWAFRQAGIQLPEGSVAQYKMGYGVPIRDLVAGDLVFWDTFGQSPGHVGIYDGEGHVIHALNPSRGIIRSDLHADMGGPMVGARRVIKEEGEVPPPPKGDGDGGEDMVVTFGNCKLPKYQTMIVNKPWEGAGFDRVPPRNNVGMCMHKWWGYGDAASLYRLFSTGGERQADALVDWSLTQEGDLVMLNEPWKTRAGWANGPADDLEGDGVLFVRKLGVSAVNSRLVSCEFEGKDDPLTEAQMDLGSSLWAYYYDAWKVSWEDYPINPKVGCNTDLDHCEIGSKECPFTGARAQRHDFQSLVKGKMKAGQVGGAPDPVDPDPHPDHDWLPKGLNEDIVKTLFGKGTRHNANGTITPFEFDMKGLISNAWLARGAKHNMYPEAKDWWILDSPVTPNVVTFANGWVLFGSGGTRSSWVWMGTENG